MYNGRRKDCGLLLYCLEQDKHPNPIIPANCKDCDKFYSVFVGRDKNMKLKDLIDKFMGVILLRIKIDGKFICETISTSQIISFYENYEIDCLFNNHETRDDMVCPYIEVWLKGEETINEPKTEK